MLFQIALRFLEGELLLPTLLDSRLHRVTKMLLTSTLRQFNLPFPFGIPLALFRRLCTKAMVATDARLILFPLFVLLRNRIRQA